VAFLGNQVFLSYTNPANPADPVVQSLDQGHNPAGQLTTTSILTNQQTGTNCDSDSLKATPTGKLVLTCEGDGPGSGSNGVITLISDPGAANQTVEDVLVTDGMGNNIEGMDDVLFPSATSGTLYVSDTDTVLVYAVKLSGLDLNSPIVSLGSFDELGIVNLETGVATPLLTSADVPDGSFDSPHGLDFIPNSITEPASMSVLAAGSDALCRINQLGERDERYCGKQSYHGSHCARCFVNCRAGVQDRVRRLRAPG
jgi:hypothetical protein